MQNGWYDTKYLVYSNLGAHSLDFASPEIVIDFFRNYLKLCSSSEEILVQKKHLALCVDSLRNYLLKQKGKDENLYD